MTIAAANYTWYAARARADLNFAVWLLAFVHGITSGTDTTTAWGVGLYLGAAALIGGMVGARILATVPPAAGRTAVR